MNLEELDGRIGEGWGGLSPNGAHVNVVLARRGSPTAASAISMFAHPSPGHSPVLCCVGGSQPEYQPIWPPTLMMNKTTATTNSGVNVRKDGRVAAASAQATPAGTA